MTLRKNIKIAIATFCSAILFVFGGVVSISENPVKAEEVFKNEQDITVTTNYQIDASTEIADSRSGMLLSATQSGAKLDIASSLCGVFELDFRAFTDSKFAAGNKVTGDEVVNPALALKTFSIIVTNANNAEESFRIGIEGGSPMNFATPQAYVEIDGRKTGIYAESKNTTGGNTMGRYTALWNTSFTNAGYSSAETAIAGSEQNVIAFDPASMKVVSKAVSGKETLIWDLSKEVNDYQWNKSFEPFESYNVTLEFTEVAPTKTAKVVLYSLNGQSLAGDTITNNVGPSVFANFKQNPVKGEKFYLPTPATYDVCGNEVSSVEVNVKCGTQTLSFYSAAGLALQKYQEGCYVVCGDASTLDISYTAYDADYAGLPMTISLPVSQSYPQIDFELSKPLQAEYGKGAIVNLPSLTVASDLFRSQPDVVVSVLKNGSVVDGYNAQPLPLSYEFSEVGEYEVVYACVNSTVKTSYAITVTEAIPALNLEYDPIDQLNVGESLYVPSGEYVKNGETKEANVYLQFPDGSVFANKKVATEAAGLYTIVYSAEFDGALYKNEYEVTVLDAVPTFITDAGEVTPATRSQLYGALSGIGLKGEDTTVYKYSKMIDLSNSTKDDTVIKIYPSFKWGWNPYLPNITLTDAHDPTNTVTLRVDFGWHEYLNCAYAYAPDQVPKSYSQGRLWKATDANKWGTNVYWPSTTGQYSDVGPSSCAISLQYDAATKCVYSGGSFVIDLDGDYQEVPWKGWTTGEVYLSFTGVTEVVVSEVFGNNFSDVYYEDEKQPSVKFDLQGYAESELPNAVVGKSYELFDCFGVDNWDESVKISTKVFYNYGTEDYTEISVKNNAFTPTKAGRYGLEYTAKDKFGNVFQKVLFVTAVNESNVIPVRFSLSENPVSNGVLGEAIALPEIIDMKGGLGTLNGKLIVYTPYGNTIDMTEDDTFTPDEVGYYTLEFIVSDYVGNGAPNEYTIMKTINVQPQATPIVYDNVLPKFVLSGATLQLPAVDAIDYFTDNSGIIPETTITAKINGTPLTVQDNKVVPTITSASEDMIVTYSATNSQGTTTKDYVVKVINPEKQEGFMTDYFQAIGDSSVEKYVQGENMYLKTTQSGAKMQFINPVLANEFSISMSVGDLSLANVDKITIRLYDYADMRISVKFDIIKNTEDTAGNSKSYICINDGKLTDISGNFYSTNSSFGFAYKQASLSAQALSGGIVGYVEKTEAGKEFKGFTSGKVWVELEFGTVEGDGVLLLMRSLNNQTLGNLSEDYIVPEFITTSTLPLTAEAGAEYTVPSVLAQDVLAPYCTATVSVAKVGGATLVQNQSADSDFKVTFNEDGRYRVLYTIIDANGQRLTRAFMVTIIEFAPPTLTINGTVPTTVSINTPIELPGATVTDNAGGECTLKIFVYDPNGRFSEILPDDNKNSATYGKYVYTPKIAGTYTLRYYAYDACANYVMQDITFTAK